MKTKTYNKKYGLAKISLSYNNLVLGYHKKTTLHIERWERSKYIRCPWCLPNVAYSISYDDSILDMRSTVKNPCAKSSTSLMRLCKIETYYSKL